MSRVDPDRAALPVLMYHSVSVPPEGRLADLAVPPGLLADQLSALTEAGYRLVGLTEAVARWRADPKVPVVAVTFDDGFLDLLVQGLPALRRAGATATVYVSAGHLGGLAVWLGRRAEAFGPLLTWDQVSELAGAGIEIGNHSWWHHPLDTLPPAHLEAEIRTSTDLLRERTGTPVTSFAYPHGYHSARVRTAVARHGYRTACEVGRRLCHPGTDRILAIPRLQPTAWLRPEDLVHLVRTGGPWLGPAVKRLARPGWRLARRLRR